MFLGVPALEPCPSKWSSGWILWAVCSPLGLCFWIRKAKNWEECLSLLSAHDTHIRQYFKALIGDEIDCICYWKIWFCYSILMLVPSWNLWTVFSNFEKIFFPLGGKKELKQCACHVWLFLLFTVIKMRDGFQLVLLYTTGMGFGWVCRARLPKWCLGWGKGGQDKIWELAAGWERPGGSETWGETEIWRHQGLRWEQINLVCTLTWFFTFWLDKSRRHLFQPRQKNPSGEVMSAAWIHLHSSVGVGLAKASCSLWINEFFSIVWYKPPLDTG